MLLLFNNHSESNVLKPWSGVARPMVMPGPSYLTISIPYMSF